jgi:Ran GTPase-activating protein (RanGAP) involved in mRNA processing and transport
VLNLASNNLGEIVLAAGWRSKEDDDMEPWVGPEGQEQDEKPGKREGIIAIANAIPDMGALAKFDISKNKIMAEGGKALAAGLKGNQVIIELNIADNLLGWDANLDDDMSCIITLADVIPGMGALIKLDISSNCIGAKQKEDLQHICMASGIELDM